MQFVYKANEKQITNRTESHILTYRTSGGDDTLDTKNRFPKARSEGEPTK
jgi:hypothetical protein